jgi:hypothetical protein
MAAAFPRLGPGWRQRVESIPLVHLPGFLLAAALVAAGGILRVASMTTASGWFGDDASPAGRTDAQRLMVAAYVATAALLWALARRAGVNRWPAALALLLFGLSPLAVEVHGQVAFDNLATPWMLGAFTAAYSQRPRVATVVLSSAAAVVAVVLEPVLLALVPVLVWQIWRWSDPGSRRYAAALGGSLFALLAGPALLVADRAAIGGAPTHGAPDRRLDTWLDLDPALLVAVVLAALVALAVVAVLPSLRPIAAATLVAAALALRPGADVRTTAVAVLLPLGALAVAGMADEAWSYPSLWLRGSVVAVGLVVVAVALPGWREQQRRLVADDQGHILRRAERWVIGNVPPDRTVLADDAMVHDLADAGFPADRLLGWSAIDHDRDLWRDVDVVVVRGSARTAPGGLPELDEVLSHSAGLAVVGEAGDRVEVRHTIGEEGTATTGAEGGEGAGGGAGSIAAATTEGHGVAAAIDFGTALARNPSLTFAPGAREALVAGEVDQRLMTALVAVAAGHRVGVDALPVDPAERRADPGGPGAGAGPLRRRVDLRAGSHAEAGEIATLLDAQQAPYRPVRIDVRGDGALTVTYAPAALG